MIGVVDYNLCNLKSVAGALERLEYDYVVTNDLEKLNDASKLILPGVGAFGDAMRHLKELGLVDFLNKKVIQEKIPILGICLGAQLMCQESFEFGKHQGLGWFDASVIRFEGPGLRVPHVGWNDCYQKSGRALFKDIPNDALFYYVHSYYMKPKTREQILAECDYGDVFTACLARDNIFAVQFHPEKSQYYGLVLLNNFLETA